jgi:copper chaperone
MYEFLRRPRAYKIPLVGILAVLAPGRSGPGSPPKADSRTGKDAAMVTETISVPEIHCDHCKASIEGALAAIGGVERATVDIPARTVTVRYDASVDRGDLVEAIEQQGYEVPGR